MTQYSLNNWLLYDGECPFCSRYVALLRLRRAMAGLRLIDARQGGGEFAAAQKAGFDLDEGMLLYMDGQYSHGDECVHRLALMSTPSDLFNRLNARIFKSRTMSRFLYPVMRGGRNLALRVLGRRKIHTDASKDAA